MEKCLTVLNVFNLDFKGSQFCMYVDRFVRVIVCELLKNKFCFCVRSFVFLDTDLTL